MTAQAMEKLILNGDEVYMATEPLAQYFKSINETPPFFSASTGCWRGYYGTWEIKDDKLFLIGLEGNVANIKERKYWDVGMDIIFPNTEEVFAEWFTGELRIPKGKMLEYVHGGYLSSFEMDLFINIDKGTVIGHRVVDNRLEEAKRIINAGCQMPPRVLVDNNKKGTSLLNKIVNLLKKSKFKLMSTNLK